MATTEPTLWPVPGAGDLYWVAEWLTDTMAPPAGLAMTQRLRAHPRVRVGFDGQSAGQERRWLENLLEANGARDWWVPLPGVGFVLQAALAAEAPGIPGAPGPMFAAGGLVAILSEDARRAELCTIEEVETNGLVLAEPTALAHPRGAWVLPVFRGYLDAWPSLARFTGDSLPWRIEFALRDPLPIEPAAMPTYREFPVLELGHDWTQDPTWQPSRELAIEDNETGPVWRADLRRQAVVTMGRNITAAGDDQVAKLLGVLWALAGRAQPVWVHTLASDLVLVEQLPGSGVSMDVEWCGLPNGPRPAGRRDVRIELHDGRVFYRRVTGVATLSGDVQRLTLDAALGATITPAEVFQVSWLTLCAQSADAARVNWWRHDVGTCTITFQQVAFEH